MRRIPGEATNTLKVEHGEGVTFRQAAPLRQDESNARHPMQSQDSRRIAAALTRLGGNGAGSVQIADVIVSTLQDIDAALSPVIGKGGVGALYKRSLYLVASSHPPLIGLHEGAPTVLDMGALKSALALQSGADAAGAGGALLQAFYELLASLVGASLTDRLLRPTWAKFLADWPPKDSPPWAR